jgi:hypothetical protein
VRRASRRFAADYPIEQENNAAPSNPNVPLPELSSRPKRASFFLRAFFARWPAQCRDPGSQASICLLDETT